MRDGWKALPLSDVVEHTIGGVWGGESGTDEVEVTVVRSTEFTKRGYLNFETGVSRSIKHSQLKSRELKEGDILLEKSGGGPDQPVGRVVYVTAEIPNKFVCSNFVQLVRPNSLEIEPLLLFHIMWQWHAINRTLEFQAQTTGIRNLRTPDYLEQEINLPPLTEQKRIVDLISSVDSYIEALQGQLESAKESRNAVLHELLTAGGDDWVETTLGEVALLNPSEPALSDTAHFAPMDAVHVGKRWLQYTEEKRDRNGARARAGDVLFARITPCLENGKIAQVQSDLERCGGSTEFIVVRGTEKCTSDFLYFWCTLKVNRDKAAELMTGTTGRQRLSWQDLGSLSLWLPSITEQERIVSNISEFDSLIESTESAITKSQNLRSGLLSDLLSGTHEIPASYDKVMGAA